MYRQSNCRKTPYVGISHHAFNHRCSLKSIHWKFSCFYFTRYWQILSKHSHDCRLFRQFSAKSLDPSCPICFSLLLLPHCRGPGACFEASEKSDIESGGPKKKIPLGTTEGCKTRVKETGKAWDSNHFNPPEVGLESYIHLYPKRLPSSVGQFIFQWFSARGIISPRLWWNAVECVRGQLDVVNGAVSGCGLRELVRQQPFKCNCAGLAAFTSWCTSLS